MSALEAAVAHRFPGHVIADQDSDHVYLVSHQRGLVRVPFAMATGGVKLGAPERMRPRHRTSEPSGAELLRALESWGRQHAPEPVPDFAPVQPPPWPGGWGPAPAVHQPQPTPEPGQEGARLHMMAALGTDGDFAPMPPSPFDHVAPDMDAHGFMPAPEPNWRR